MKLSSVLATLSVFILAVVATPLPEEGSTELKKRAVYSTCDSWGTSTQGSFTVFQVRQTLSACSIHFNVPLTSTRISGERMRPPVARNASVSALYRVVPLLGQPRGRGQEAHLTSSGCSRQRMTPPVTELLADPMTTSLTISTLGFKSA
jgi:hypothetical protein